MSDYADLILKSNSIYTAKEKNPFSGYIAIRDDKILAIQKDTIPKELICENTKYFDFGDKTITPGFTDVHCFFSGYSMNFVGCDLSTAKNCAELISAAKAYSETISAQKPVLGHGWNSEIIHPDSTALLDEAFGTRPVILFAEGCETCWMNQAAIEIYRFTPSTCYPEAYVRLFSETLTDRDFIIPEFKRYMKMMNSKGVTSVKEMGFDQFYGFTDILSELEDSNELTLRVHFMSQPVAEPMNLEFGKKMQEKFNGEFVQFSGYNQMTDGSISQLCGDLKKPYLCADTTCAQKIDWKQLREDTQKADAAGFRFSLHAQGDAAISKVLDIYETCKKDSEGKIILKHSITDLEFSDPDDLERMGKLGVIAEIYPQIQSIANRKEKLNMIADKIGMERGQYYWNRRKMQDSGVLLSCGTDLPLLIDDIPESIYHAVGGYFPEGGEAFNKQNMLTLPELLNAWTYGGAVNLSQESILGSLEVGKKADIAVFSDNLFTTPIENIRSLKVEMTMVNGKTVYQMD